jgi:hypothetical protein
MMETFQVSAFALPVPYGITDEFESRDTAKIRDREHGIKNGLQAGIVAFFRKHVHLEEPLVRILLHLNEIRDLDCRSNFGKIRSLSGGIGFGFRHFIGLLLNDNKPTHGRTTPYASAR